MRSNIAAKAAAFLTIILATGLSVPASAAFTWLNDPNSGVDFSGPPTMSCGTIALGPCGNSITYNGFGALNGGVAQADLGLFLPFIWPRDASQSTQQQAIAWDNALGGWYSANFDNLGTSLLVTVDITTSDNRPNGTVLAGEVADSTGAAVFGPSSDSFGIPWPNETLAPTDALPFVDLGSFAANEEKTFGLVFTYTFGDGRSCNLQTITCRTSIAPFTLAPVPEPSTWAMMALGFVGLGFAGYRSTRRGGWQTASWAKQDV